MNIVRHLLLAASIFLFAGCARLRGDENTVRQAVSAALRTGNTGGLESALQTFGDMCQAIDIAQDELARQLGLEALYGRYSEDSVNQVRVVLSRLRNAFGCPDPFAYLADAGTDASDGSAPCRQRNGCTACVLDPTCAWYPAVAACESVTHIDRYQGVQFCVLPVDGGTDATDSSSDSGQDTSDAPPDFCATYPCANGGLCLNDTNSYHCECPPGYNGANCENNFKECELNPCQNGGTCTDGVGSYFCTCPTGWSGVNCETNINECADGPCLNGGTCTDGVNSFVCECAPGFSGPVCENVTGCSCPSNAQCVTSTSCACNPGFVGDGTACIATSTTTPSARIASAAQTYTYFGQSVAISEDLIDVGESAYNNGPATLAGVVRIYQNRRPIGTPIATISPPVAQQSERFGSSVALYGDMLAIGAIGTRNSGAQSIGSVRLYRRNIQGTFQLFGTVYGEQAGGFFGGAVALNAQYLAVGSEAHDTMLGGVNAGQVRIYEYTAPATTLRYIVDSPQPRANFGSSVALSESQLIVGATGEASDGESGAVYVYRRSTTNHSLVATIRPLRGARVGDFGRSVAIAGDVILIGSDRDYGDVEGSIWFYQPNSPTPYLQLALPRSTSPRGYGRSIAVYNQTLLVGAETDRPAGAVYVYDQNLSP